MARASEVDQRLPLNVALLTDGRARMHWQRALRVHVNLGVQGKSLTKPPFWRVKYLQSKVLYVSEPAVSGLTRLTEFK